ncbi:unnamed protein product [Rangifer tarandus platyrhynchus]|uniref:Uncharacterized protein n=1 Tax=Rangifer tarandus platyrhynchus TaxID=3082113 RepID=A0AC59Z2W8_RANTA
MGRRKESVCFLHLGVCESSYDQPRACRLRQESARRGPVVNTVAALAAPPSPLAFSPWRPGPRAACSPSSCGPPLQEILGSLSLVSSHAHHTLGHRSLSLSSRCHRNGLGSRI